MIQMSDRPPDETNAEESNATNQPRNVTETSDQTVKRIEALTDYLLVIASKRLNRDLWKKVAPSDIVQDAMISACRTHDRIQGAGDDQLKAWLRSIVVNKVVDVQRRYTGTVKRGVAIERPLETNQHDLFSGDLTPSGFVSKGESVDALLTALNKLPEDRRQVILLRDFDGMEFADIGEKMGRSGESVRALWWRAVEELRKEIGEE